MTTDMDIRTLSLQEAWNTFKTEIEMTEKEYKEARFGVTIKFDINDYLKNRIAIKGKVGKAFIRGKSHSLEDFETELEKRERIIKDWLLENFGDIEIATPRGIGE